MNPDSSVRSDLLAAGVPTFVVVLMPLVLVGVWGLGHVVSRRLRVPARSRFAAVAALAGRVAVGTVALWAVWQAVSRFVVLESSWSLWTCGLIGALAVEIVMVLFGWEKRIAAPAVGRALLALRLMAIAVVLLILVQPVLAWTQQRKIERRVVVLVDDSESMQLVDRQMTATEKLDGAVFRGAAVAGSRPGVAALGAQVREFQSVLARELAVWQQPGAPGAEADQAVMARRTEALTRTADAGGKVSTAAAPVFEAARPLAGGMDEGGRQLLNEMRSWLCELLPAELTEARSQMSQGRPQPAGPRLTKAALLIGQAVDAMPALTAAVDEALVRQLDGAGRQALDEAALVPRARLAREVITKKDPATGRTLLERLEATYDVSVMRFGRVATEAPTLDFPPSPGDADFRMKTDLAAALDQTIERVPAESLAGVLLLSDGRHNGERPVDDAARSLGLTGAPIHAVAIGSVKGPKDAAFLKVEAPESIYLGDTVKVRAEVKADGMKGGQLKITLRENGKEVDSQTVAVPDDSFRTSVRLGYTPSDKGIFAYALTIEPVAGELFATNNSWPFETAVTDDRTNVLLVDSYPRWEFRYLRNLFYGRDKSVHLQYVLLNPDEIADQAPLAPVFASAGRKFGDAEATRLPEKFDEWMRFDVIIVGDVAPAAMPAQMWETIEKAVSERGAMLIVVAGARAMPHAYQSEVVRRLLPVEYAPTPATLFAGPEEAFAVRLTAEGKSSPILSLSASQVENAQIWDGMPSFMWRHPVRGAKPGAEVLAFAEPAGRRPMGDGATTEERLAAFSQQRQFEAEHALLTTRRYGLGKVALFAFDQSWRLRYGVGDTYHHRLWGNLLRWGTGENLRAGTDNVRLGTDKLTYETGDRVKVLARLTTEGYKPETKAAVTALVFGPDGQTVARRAMTYRDGSSGIYEADLESLPQTGRYRVELAGDDVARLLRSGGTAKVETHFTQLATLNPVELGDLALDADTLRRVAMLSGGRVVAPADAESLAGAFGIGTKTLAERRETTLWDNWPLLTLALGVLTAEWLLRRKAGLA